LYEGLEWFGNLVDPAALPRLAGFVLDAFATGAEPVDSELDQLTSREREVMRLIARGYSYKEVAPGFT
jgi:DNA-binding NarL/FixJ family response regulator